MGIGSFFASIFQKEDAVQQADRKREDRMSQTGRPEPLVSQEPQPASGKEAAKTAGRTEKTQPADAVPAGRKSFDKKESPEAADRTPGDNHPAKGGRQGGMTDEKRAYYQAKKDLYQYISQTLDILYVADMEDGWDRLTAIEGPSQEAAAAIGTVGEKLPEKLRDLLSPFLDEEKTASPASLRPAFLKMLLPFYPAYYTYFKEFGYNTFLNRDALELFRRLTGRKFRLGYRNRYENGIPAFEWQGSRYKVYDSKGALLCDAVFENGQVKDGYAVQQEEASDDPDWKVRRKGTYRDGQLIDETVEYIYQPDIC